MKMREQLEWGWLLKSGLLKTVDILPEVFGPEQAPVGSVHQTKYVFTIYSQYIRSRDLGWASGPVDTVEKKSTERFFKPLLAFNIVCILL